MKFEDTKVSTQTFTVRSNIAHLDLYLFYTHLNPCQNKNGTKILCMKYKSMCKGDDQKKEKKVKKVQVKNKTRNFLNCVSLIIEVDKLINVKTFQNGVFQLTGCKDINHVKSCLDIIIEQLNLNPHLFTLNGDDKNFIIYIKSAMRNIDFAMGFKIDKIKLLKYIDTETSYKISPVVTSNMGVKIKIPIILDKLPILRIEYDVDLQKTEKNLFLEDCKEIIEPDPKKREKKFEEKYVTVSIFLKGKIVISCIDETFQRVHFDIFFELLNKIKPQIINHDISNKTFKF
jgi:TATA-box binding protein (TBP) (component of TFIID and TFIIIB)